MTTILVICLLIRKLRDPKIKCYPFSLKGSNGVAKKNIIWCIWCNAMFMWLSLKKHFPHTYSIFHIHIPHIIVAPLCPIFLKRFDFYKAHRSEKQGVL